MSDFADVFGDWLTHVVVVEAYQGAGMEGATFAAPVTLGGENSEIEGVEIMLEPKRRLIRSSVDGNQIVSETTLYVTNAGASSFPLHSRVTLPSGEQTTVERVATGETYGLFDHMVVNLA